MVRPVAVVVTLVVFLAGLAACANPGAEPGQSPESSGGAAAEGFPVTLEHAFGEITLDSRPERVLTWGWGSTDASLALGVVPVAIPTAIYGGNEDQVLPWNAEKLAELGAETPTLLANPDGGTTIPFEEIAAAAPDVILAVYSGITEEEYRRLSEIAPTIAYPDQPWATAWQDVVTTVGAALGRKAEAETLLADIDRATREAGAAHPELAGKSVIALFDVAEQLAVYKEIDPRVVFLTDLGMTVPPAVADVPAVDDGFYGNLSYEKADLLVSDVLLIYSETEESLQKTLDRPSIKNLPQIKSGRYTAIVGQQLVAAGSPPTALSLTWALDEYTTKLAAAAARTS
ncbi:ABC transporter substrate-binding protein [Microlunatus sp. GCM10028923]|uniref:ABC transporter substrate-binding protein n=1 Tax=Microlunatus sp. GCM10028923 TaxID=3273400 RepID=UPI0036123323